MLIDTVSEKSAEGRPARPSGTRIPVVLLACAGRSGSTLLDRLIGAHEGFCSTGELRFIWERSFTHDELCGCGAPFSRCPFWDQVSRRAFGAPPGALDTSAAVLLRRCLDQSRQAPWLLSSRSPAAHQAAVALYGALLERLYGEVLAVSGARAVVDSSGDGTHGLLLARLPGIELHVVHLVRDPRAVAFSWKRTRERPEVHWGSERMAIEHAGTSARRWMLNNALAERLARRASSYCRLRYEDLVREPHAALAQILAPHRWAGAPLGALREHEIALGPSHTVSGNPSRFRHGSVRISLDDEWRRAISASDRRTVTAITWPLLARYGYPLGGGR